MSNQLYLKKPISELIEKRLEITDKMQSVSKVFNEEVTELAKSALVIANTLFNYNIKFFNTKDAIDKLSNYVDNPDAKTFLEYRGIIETIYNACNSLNSTISIKNPDFIKIANQVVDLKNKDNYIAHGLSDIKKKINYHELYNLNEDLSLLDTAVSLHFFLKERTLTNNTFIKYNRSGRSIDCTKFQIVKANRSRYTIKLDKRVWGQISDDTYGHKSKSITKTLSEEETLFMCNQILSKDNDLYEHYNKYKNLKINFS